MAYLVVAYPKISQRDFDWIQDYRRENDLKHFSIVKPHFTLVFPMFDVSREDFVREVKHELEGFKKFDFEIRVSTVNKDVSGNFYHEFLVPDRGYSNIVKLHDKLYSGAFAGDQRFDVDFIPHIGIGNAKEAAESKKRVDELNKQGIDIKGTLDVIDVVEYAEGPVQTVDRFDLI